jgi:hypothetical protein
MMERRKRDVKLVASVVAFLVILLVVIIYNILDSNASDRLCKPGLLCLEDTLAYRSLTCGLMVNTNSDSNSICKGGELVEDHPLVRMTVGEGQPLMVVDTALLDLEEKELEWEYYSLEEIPAEYMSDKVYTSPSADRIVAVYLGD